MYIDNQTVNPSVHTSTYGKIAFIICELDSMLKFQKQIIKVFRILMNGSSILRYLISTKLQLQLYKDFRNNMSKRTRYFFHAIVIENKCKLSI
jgi:hypothetical protein